MYKQLPLLSLVFLGTCAVEDGQITDDAALPEIEPPETMAGHESLPPETTDWTYEPEPEEPEDPLEGLSAYERGQLEIRVEHAARDTGLLGGRMGVSEAGFHGAMKDIPGIYEVARNTKGSTETLFERLQELSPHVARVKQPTRPRQLWTSTLPAEGDEPGEGWVECTNWYEDSQGRMRGLPKNCAGVWATVKDEWVEIREFAAKMARRNSHTIPGKPWTWGGLMDLARFLDDNPHMCVLSGPPHNHNFFFGKREDNAEFCIEPTPEQLHRSRELLAAVRRKDQRIRSSNTISASLAAAPYVSARND
jgi:hypothetical protein